MQPGAPLTCEPCPGVPSALPARGDQSARSLATAKRQKREDEALLTHKMQLEEEEEEQREEGADGLVALCEGGHEATAPLARDQAEEPSAVSDADIFDVELIVAERKRGGRAQFLIRWQG